MNLKKQNSINQNLWRWLGLTLISVLLSLALLACGSETSTRSLVTFAPGTTEAVATTTPAVAQAPATTAAASTSPATVATTTPTAAAATTASAAATTATAATRLTDQAESATVVDVVKKYSPAVVTVYNRTKYSPSRGQLPGAAPRATPTPGASSSDTQSGNFVVQGIGSGVIISPDGYIVTNDHVIDGQEDLTVALNDGKTSVPAKLVGRDKLGDLAVLKIDAPISVYARWTDKAEVGETVVAIGSALGNFRNSVSKGVISGLNRSLPGDTGSSVYIQTDAPLNHGNSGGPLFNLKGEIVGINTAVVRSTAPGRIQGGSSDVAEGLGFAIPGTIAKNLAEQIMAKGKVVRPYFGITYQMITPADAGTISGGRTIPAVEGAWINSSARQTGVVRGGPADKAGLKDNDVITAIDGVPLNDGNPLPNIILKYRPGDTIKLTVQRGDQTLTMDLTLAERPADL